MTDLEEQVVRDLLLRAASAAPGRLAFADRERELTFGELAERASACAGGLQHRGVRQADRVAIAMPAGVPLVEVFWALQLIGAVPCIFNPDVPRQTLARRLELVAPRLVVDEELVGDLGRGRAVTSPADVSPDDLAFLQRTSGTSGMPRASMIRHRNVMAYLCTNRTDQWMSSEDVLVDWVPPWHDLGLVRFILGSVRHAASCHIVKPAVRTIPEWLATISRVGGTYSAAPDFAFRLAVQMLDGQAVELSSLRLMRSGGEPVRWSSLQAFEDHFGLSGVAAPGYGLGEVTLSVAEHLPGEEIPVDAHGNVSCGPPNPGLEVRAGFSPEAPEEILVRGETVFAGYFDAPAETRETLREGWLRTGDSGYQDGAGNLFVLGRRNGMIKRGGSVVAPRELEEAAYSAPGVRFAAATAVTRSKRDGEAIVVLVETDEAIERSDEQIAADVSTEVVAALGFAPGQVMVVPPKTIPRTENGKVRHARLRAMLEEPAGRPAKPSGGFSSASDVSIR